LAEEISNWFELDRESPYMLLVADIKEEKKNQMTKEEEQLFGIDKLNSIRSDISAVTHVDFSTRVQTVHRETNPRYYKLIETFYNATGCPLIINTSFNVRGEPIVCSPSDAFLCFMNTDMDLLAVDNYLLDKEEQKNVNMKEISKKIIDFDLD